MGTHVSFYIKLEQGWWNNLIKIRSNFHTMNSSVLFIQLCEFYSASGLYFLRKFQ